MTEEDAHSDLTSDICPLFSESAPAKINLYLHVVGRRPDGYHLLESLVVFAECGDVITAESAADFSLQIDGPFAHGLSAGDDNLVLRAARGLAGLLGIGKAASLKLTKNLPIASGIGGGSADAAATIEALLPLWSMEDVDRKRLAVFALKLGADVPVCLYGRSSVVSGIGETTEDAGRLPAADLLLVNPGVATPTPQVFKARTGPFSAPSPWSPLARISVPELVARLKLYRNDLTGPAMTVAPVIRDVLRAIEATPGCLLSRLSGSGATCFGIYESAAAAEAARAAILAAHPDWWAVATKIAARI
ncbi:MAG TPA: 4-(cytidine 5'-diphospho)-2-C-methyl-D-erythritol kinase [Candidatus Cybelea sp.]|nr:4-(cytidine 5'-diphospho)-2-C-methyl-D-erythritol kinase [Candidatus Cybelea sp.]